ncbi:type II secretion system protein GspI [Comamonas serinivorans]|uniref:Type II secretion system protein I n=1 Tax=Comamonas serinivorans TaxID=1082851 RepID=A0A1Y0ERY8_9BURK|nr:type II secretion system protein GspI [Comamonas serinivorans]
MSRTVWCQAPRRASRQARCGPESGRTGLGRPVQAGFTLVEVMVALAVCAIALTAGTKAMQAVTRNAERQANAVLGNLCADNALSNLRITGQYPNVGDSTQACPQAGRDLQVRLTVRPTANPSFRRVDAEVFLAGEPVVQEVTIVGRY